MSFKKIRQNRFIIKTQTAAVTVLGTHFNSYKDDTFFETTLIEGSVKLSATKPEIVNVILKPSQKEILVIGGFSSINVKKS